MRLFEFVQNFPTEESCRTYLKDLREKQGIICKVCDKKTKHYWLEKVEKFQCSVCNSRTNLRSGTMMEKSKIPLHMWFTCIYHMTTTKKPVSALEMKRQLGLNRYEPIWYMMNKIRMMMGKRDEKYKLKGEIEIDDAFFEIVNLPKKDILGNIKIEEQKRGRGSQNKIKVMVMVESTPTNPDKTYIKKRRMGYVKMVVMDNLSNEGVNYEVEKSVEPTAKIISDAYRGYSRLKDVVKEHSPMVVKPEEAMKKLPWVHTVISNAKREFLGTHHSIGKDYLQAYLNEFCYKLNRRNFTRDSFEGMLLAGSNDTWY